VYFFQFINMVNIDLVKFGQFNLKIMIKIFNIHKTKFFRNSKDIDPMLFF